MTEVLIPSLEEHAYHLGWISYFNKDPCVVIRNPYIDQSHAGHMAAWDAGFRAAEIVAESIADV